MIEIKEKEKYLEIDIFSDGEKIGLAEVDLTNKMLSRLNIFPPCQNQGYGTEAVRMLTEKYNLDNLWVNSNNEIAIHVYEKNGFKIVKPTMCLMMKGDANEG